MEYRPLGPFSVSILGLGGLHFGVYQDEAESTSIIHAALDAGINLIDTAPTYGQGQSEAIIGKALVKRRHEAIIATKVGIEPVPVEDGIFRAFPVPMTPHYIRQKLEASLRALQTDYIDLYQIHAPHLATLQDALATMNDLVAEGKVRAFGCANFNTWQVKEAQKLAPGLASLQMQYSIIDRRGELNLIPTCQRLGLGVLCNRVLARGILSGEYRHGPPFPTESRAARSARLARELARDAGRRELANFLHDYARDQGRSGIDLAIAWWRQQPGATCAVLGMHSERQVRANTAALTWHLTPRDISTIRETIWNMQLTEEVMGWPRAWFEK